MELTILYRGPLASCNYDCSYCPFAKQHDSAAELEVDRQQLERFVSWACEQTDTKLSVFFTPWGEALHRRWYQSAMQTLSHLSHLQRVAIQTNLAANLDWLADCQPDKVGLWCTYHPSQMGQDDFLKQVHRLRRLGISHSVGMVGLRESFTAIQKLREALPSGTYLWINAFKDVPDYYESSEIDWLETIDPHFRTNTRDYPSFGKACNTGEKVISVDGQGNIRRCHFIKNVIGNIYSPEFTNSLRERVCSRAICECHIGYIHMPDLELAGLYGDGLLHRVPVSINAEVTQ